MKKFLKELCVVAFTFVLLIGLTGCGNNEEEGPNKNNNQQQQEQSENNNSSLDVGKYKVEKNNNSVSVITNDGSGISTTTYYFENGKITSAKVTTEFSSKSIAESSYNTMKNESAIMNQYSDIKLDGKKIVLTLKSEILSAYNTFDLNAFYDLMNQTYQAYME